MTAGNENGPQNQTSRETDPVVLHIAGQEHVPVKKSKHALGAVVVRDEVSVQVDEKDTPPDTTCHTSPTNPHYDGTRPELYERPRVVPAVEPGYSTTKPYSHPPTGTEYFFND